MTEEDIKRIAKATRESRATVQAIQRVSEERSPEYLKTIIRAIKKARVGKETTLEAYDRIGAWLKKHQAGLDGFAKPLGFYVHWDFGS